jgi:PEP-CTERM motif
MNASKNQLRFFAAITVLAPLGFLPELAQAGVLYSNGFEAGDPGTADFYDSTTGNQGQNITVVANGGGALGLTAPSGTHYAEIANTDDAYSIANGLPSGYGQSVFTDYGYARNGGTFDPITGAPLGPGVATGGAAFYESTAYYINTNWAQPAATYAPAFWIDTTPYNDPAFADESNFRISVPGDGTVQVDGFAGSPGTNGAVATIGTSGWYTFKTTFEDSGGFVSNDLSVIDSLGNTVGSFSGVSTMPFADLTGTNYGDWTTVWQNGFGATTGPNENGAADVLGIDDVQVGTVPEPASFSLLGVGALALMRRRRQA